MAGGLKGIPQQASSQQGQGQSMAGLYDADSPLTQGQYMNLQQQQKASPVFQGGADNMSGRIQAIRQLLAARGQGGEGKTQVRRQGPPPGQEASLG